MSTATSWSCPLRNFQMCAAAKSSRRDAGLRRGGNAKRRRQLRLFSGQRDGVERGGVAAGQRPEISEDFAGRLHGEFLNRHRDIITAVIIRESG
jgi:hypothetical protein